jgi:hypothetical protein
VAIPKVIAHSAAPVSAFLEATVDIGSITAATALVVELAAPKAFKIGRPVLMQLKPGQTALEANALFSQAECVENSGKKIRFRIGNLTAVAIDPASKVYWFIQL